MNALTFSHTSGHSRKVKVVAKKYCETSTLRYFSEHMASKYESVDFDALAIVRRHPHKKKTKKTIYVKFCFVLGHE